MKRKSTIPSVRRKIDWTIFLHETRNDGWLYYSPYELDIKQVRRFNTKPKQTLILFLLFQNFSKITRKTSVSVLENKRITLIIVQRFFDFLPLVRESYIVASFTMGNGMNKVRAYDFKRINEPSTYLFVFFFLSLLGFAWTLRRELSRLKRFEPIDDE